MSGPQDLASRLSSFVVQAKRLESSESRIDRLSGFFGRFDAVRPSRRSIGPTKKPGRAGLQAFFAAARDPLAKQRAAGSSINPWTVAGLRRAEVRNAAVLAALFSPRLCGDQGVAFLDAFCRRITDPHSLLPSTAELQAGYSVRTEHCPVAEQSERVDITIEGPSFVMGVEVKIDAPEGVDQLQRYMATIEKWGRQRGKRSLVLFLAPYRSSEPNVLSAKWGDVRAAGRSIILRHNTETNLHAHLLLSFMRHITSFGA